MTIQSQLTSLALSQRLRELGVPQEAEFWWQEHGKSIYTRVETMVNVGIKKWDRDSVCAAYSVAELGELLPGRTEKDGIIVVYTSHKNADGTWTSKAMKIDVRNRKDNEHFAVEVANTEAEARGNLIAYLLENHLITL